jgi:hypothetical protein
MTLTARKLKLLKLWSGKARRLDDLPRRQEADHTAALRFGAPHGQVTRHSSHSTNAAPREGHLLEPVAWSPDHEPLTAWCPVRLPVQIAPEEMSARPDPITSGVRGLYKSETQASVGVAILLASGKQETRLIRPDCLRRVPRHRAPVRGVRMGVPR